MRGEEGIEGMVAESRQTGRDGVWCGEKRRKWERDEKI